MNNESKRLSLGRPPSYRNAEIACIIFSFLLFAAGALRAQNPRASISGVVSDTSGAVIPSATITVTDIARGLTYRAETNGAGVYVIQHLIPSTYKVTATKTGFRVYMVNSFPLTAAQEAVLNVTLTPGSVTQQVTVKSRVQMVEPSNATLGGYINQTAVTNLPLPGHMVFNVFALVPGVTYQHKEYDAASGYFSNANEYSVNGGLDDTSQVELDGVSILGQNPGTGGRMASYAQPPADSIQEVKIETNDYSAGYGPSGGGISTMVTKSGTNQVHGDLFEYDQNNALAMAGNYWTNAVGGKNGPVRYNDFGGSAGAPIIKNRMFAFAALERIVNIGGWEQGYTVPTPAEKNGDFSEDYVNRGGVAVVPTLYNPYTTRPDPNNPGQFIRDPIPGNIITPSMMTVNGYDATAAAAVGAKLASYYPNPNGFTQYLADANGVARPLTSDDLNNWGASAFPQWQFNTREDFQISPSKRLFVRYLWDTNTIGNPDDWHNPAQPNSQGNVVQIGHNAVVGYTQTFGSATVMDLRLGFNHGIYLRPPTIGQNFDITTLGLPANLAAFDMVGGAGKAFPQTSAQGYTGESGANTLTLPSQNWYLSGNVSRVIGKHTVTAGAGWTWNGSDVISVGRPYFAFTSLMTQGPNPFSPTGPSGDGFASQLLGAGSGGSIAYWAKPYNYNNYYYQFVQDDFKLTPKLTLNLGFRLEEETGTAERHNQMTAIDPYMVDSALSGLTATLSDGTVMPLTVRGGYVYPGSGADTLGRRQIRPLEWKPSPRVGIAYMLNNKTVIRAGAGIFYGFSSTENTNGFTGGAFTIGTSWLATLPDGITPNPAAPLSNPYPDGFNYPKGASLGAFYTLGSGLGGGWPQALRTPYMSTWNFNIQRSFAHNYMLQVAYVGSKSTHWPLYGTGAQGMTQLTPQVMSQYGSHLKDVVPNPFYGKTGITGSVYSQPTIQEGWLLQPFPGYTSIFPSYAAWGNGWYEAFEASLEKRLSGGTTFIANYVWSKNEDDLGDSFQHDSGYSGNLQNWYCFSCSKGLGAYDVPQHFSLGLNSLLPFGRGRKWGSNWNKIENTVLGGWQLDWMVLLQSGPPLDFTNSVNTCNCALPVGYQTPNLVGNIAIPSNQRTPYHWFNTAAFAPPAAFTFGTTPREEGLVRADGKRQWDMALDKNFNLFSLGSERFTLQLRGEMYNVPNTPLFAPPDTEFTSPTFGSTHIDGQFNSARYMQVSARLFF